MVAKAPLDRPHYIPEAQETVEQGMARYESIASDVAEVMRTEKPLFKGADGKLRTSALIMSVMLHEGGFRRDVDLGLGAHSKGDHGNSVCLMQLNVGKGRSFAWNVVKDRAPRPADPPSEIQQGWTAKELLADRKKCITAGLRVMRVSFASCGRMPQRDWLRAYASGSCDAGAPESASRMGLAFRWYAANRPAFDDSVLTPEPVLRNDAPSTVAHHGKPAARRRSSAD